MAASPLRARFLGTGTSTALPVGPCLAEVSKPSRDVIAIMDAYNAASSAERDPSKWGGYDPKAGWPKSVACTSCRDAVDNDVSDGWKNRRGNPSLVLSKPDAEGVMRNVVVDVGKTFREQSCKFFPRWGVKRIDAVLITHGHADAYNGLDDLREWNMRQGGALPVYCSRTTFETIEATFPYLVDRSKASGGGEIAILDFVIIEDESEFDIFGIHVTTVPGECWDDWHELTSVPHGRYFYKPTLPVYRLAPSAPGTAPGSPQLDSPSMPIPFLCLGFVFDRQLVYLSDVSSVPDESISRIHMAVKGQNGQHAAAPVLVIDTLWPVRPHASHVSFPQAMEIAIRIKPVQTLLVGMSHPVTNWMWEEIGRAVNGEAGKEPHHKDHLLAQSVIERVWSTEEMKHIAAKVQDAGLVSPAWDGLALEMTPHGALELPLGQGSAGGWIL